MVLCSVGHAGGGKFGKKLVVHEPRGGMVRVLCFDHRCGDTEIYLGYDECLELSDAFASASNTIIEGAIAARAKARQADAKPEPGCTISIGEDEQADPLAEYRRGDTYVIPVCTRPCGFCVPDNFDVAKVKIDVGITEDVAKELWPADGRALEESVKAMNNWPHKYTTNSLYGEWLNTTRIIGPYSEGE